MEVGPVRAGGRSEHENQLDATGQQFCGTRDGDGETPTRSDGGGGGGGGGGPQQNTLRQPLSEAPSTVIDKSGRSLWWSSAAADSDQL